MDPYASLHGKDNTVLLLDCRSEEHSDIAVPPTLAMLIVDTGVRRRLSGSSFNTRRDECRQAVSTLRLLWPQLHTLRDVPAADLDRALDYLPEALGRRVRHVVGECERVQQGAAALQVGDLVAFQRAMENSHASSRADYEVTIPELDLLAEVANTAPGCVGARVSGAGFGGAILAVVESPFAEAVAETLRVAYRSSFDHEPRVEHVHISDGAACQTL
jgi:galactokinase